MLSTLRIATIEELANPRATRSSMYASTVACMSGPGVGGGQSAGEFYTPPEVGTIMSRVLQPEPGMTIYDPTCGSGGLLIKCERRPSGPSSVRSLTRLAKTAILYAVDRERQEAVIGPAASVAGTSGYPHEHGGRYRGTR